MLDELLKSILANNYNDYEIVIIDQSSDALTKLLVDSKYDKYTFIRYIKSEVMCSSDSRNRGWVAAKADNIVFVDDDETVSKHWLNAFADAFKTLESCYGIIGGRVLPIFYNKKPAWIPSELSYLLPSLDAGEIKGDFPPGWLPGGGNMGISKLLISEVGGFDTRVGLKRDGVLPYLGGEDSLLALNVEKRGLKFLYLPEALVYHPVTKERLNRRFFLFRNYREGVTSLHLGHLQHKYSRQYLKQNIINELQSIRMHSIKFCKMFNPFKSILNDRSMYELAIIAKSLGSIRHSCFLLKSVKNDY